MLLGAKLHPHILLGPPATLKVNTLISRPIDVAGPKEAEPAPLMHVLARDTAKFHIYIVRSAQSEGGPAFHMEIGRGRLVQLGRGGVYLGKGHGSSTRFKKNTAVAKLSLTVEHMLQIEPRNPRHKDTAGAFLVSQAPQTVIAGPVILMSGVVPNHGGKVAHSKGIMSHGLILPARTW